MRGAVTLKEIQLRTAEASRLRVSDLVGAARARPIAHARQRAIYVARRLCPHLSYPALGRAFGGRDHTTAIHADQAVEKRLADPACSVEEGAAIAAILQGLGVEDLPPPAPRSARAIAIVDRDLAAHRQRIEQLQAERANLLEPR